jgi:hypothetical protein
MGRLAVSLAWVAVACLCAGGDPAWAAKKSKTPVLSNVKKLEMSPQELRIRVRALIRPTLGIVEQTADRGLRDVTDPTMRRGILSWKIESTTILLSTMLRTDPVLALADAWGYAFQVESLLAQPEVAARYAAFGPESSAAMALIRAKFRAFWSGIQGGLDAAKAEELIRGWANRNPIEGALYRRPPMDSEFAAVLANAQGGGAFAALGSLEETTSDVLARMDLYTMYLPRLARWEGELAVDDLAQGVDPKALLSDFQQFTRAADRIATVAEAAPETVRVERVAATRDLQAERVAATRDLQAERRAVIDAVRRERIATLEAVEAMAQRLVDRSSDPLNAAVRKDLEELVAQVETMRRSLISDAELSLDRVVDHAFVRALELLLIAAALAAAGVVLWALYARR